MCAKLPSLGLERETFNSVELVVSSRSDSASDSEGSNRAKQSRRRLSSEDGDLLNIAEKQACVTAYRRERERGFGWSTKLKKNRGRKRKTRRDEMRRGK
jgi:hypothetical protein